MALKELIQLLHSRAYSNQWPRARRIALHIDQTIMNTVVRYETMLEEKKYGLVLRLLIGSYNEWKMYFRTLDEHVAFFDYCVGYSPYGSSMRARPAAERGSNARVVHTQDQREPAETGVWGALVSVGTAVTGLVGDLLTGDDEDPEPIRCVCHNECWTCVAAFVRNCPPPHTHPIDVLASLQEPRGQATRLVWGGCPLPPASRVDPGGGVALDQAAG